MNQLKGVIDAKYYPRDVKRAKEQESLHVKHGDISIMESANPV